MNDTLLDLKNQSDCISECLYSKILLGEHTPRVFEFSWHPNFSEFATALVHKKSSGTQEKLWLHLFTPKECTVALEQFLYRIK